MASKLSDCLRVTTNEVIQELIDSPMSRKCLCLGHDWWEPGDSSQILHWIYGKCLNIS